MIIVPVGYGLGPALFSNEEVRGGSAWGAGTFANGDGSRQASKLELDLAEYQVGNLHLCLFTLSTDAKLGCTLSQMGRVPPGPFKVDLDQAV